MPQVAVKWLYFPPSENPQLQMGFLIYMNVVVLCQVLKQKSTLNITGVLVTMFQERNVMVLYSILLLLWCWLCQLCNPLYVFFFSNPPHPTNVNVQTQTSYWLQVEIYSPNVLLNAHHNLVTNRLPPYGSYRLELMQGKQGSRNMCFALFSVKMKV